MALRRSWQAQLAIGTELHRGVKEGIAVPPGFLGVVHRRIGVRHQFALIAGVVGYRAMPRLR